MVLRLELFELIDRIISQIFENSTPVIMILMPENSIQIDYFLNEFALSSILFIYSVILLHAY